MVPVYGSVLRSVFCVLCSVLLLQFKKFNCGWEVTALMLDSWLEVATNFHESFYNIRRKSLLGLILVESACHAALRIFILYSSFYKVSLRPLITSSPHQAVTLSCDILL